MDDRAENLNYPWDEEKNQSRKPKTTAAARTRGKSTVGESVDQVTLRRDYKYYFFLPWTYVCVCIAIGRLSLTVNTSIYYVLSEDRTATCYEH